MKKIFYVLLIILFILTSCNNDKEIDATKSSLNDLEDTEKTEMESNNIFITIGERKLTAMLVSNSATKALKALLPLTVNMEDYGGFEKVGSLGTNLPTSNEQITTEPCEFVLYQGHQLVIFYGSNSWSYTRLGKITGITADELKTILGNGDVSITLSI